MLQYFRILLLLFIAHCPAWYYWWFFLDLLWSVKSTRLSLPFVSVSMWIQISLIFEWMPNHALHHTPLNRCSDGWLCRGAGAGGFKNGRIGVGTIKHVMGDGNMNLWFGESFMKSSNILQFWCIRSAYCTESLSYCHDQAERWSTLFQNSVSLPYAAIIGHEILAASPQKRLFRLPQTRYQPTYYNRYYIGKKMKEVWGCTCTFLHIGGLHCFAMPYSILQLSARFQLLSGRRAARPYASLISLAMV